MMAVSESAVERVILENLRDRYVGEGFAFFDYPGRELVPAFLRGYRPDAIAISPRQRLAIDIKTHRANADPEQLSRVASLFSDHPDWKFVVIFADEEPQDGVLSTPSKVRIERELTEAEALARKGHLRAAFAIAWGALEAAARLLRRDHPAQQNRAQPPRQVLECLEGEGFLDHTEAKPLWDYVHLRNAVVHGDLVVDIDDAAVADVVRAVRALLAQVSHEAKADARHQ